MAIYIFEKNRSLLHMTISLGNCSLIYLHGVKCAIATKFIYLLGCKQSWKSSASQVIEEKKFTLEIIIIITLIDEMYLSSFMDEVHPSSI